MKNINKFLLTLFMPVLLYSISGCNKYDNLIPLTGFTVTTSKLTYRVGDSVIFNVNGKPNEIVFFSGEPGKQYANINRDSAAGGINKLIFQSSMQQGTLPNNDSLFLLISSNLQTYDSTGIANATWTNITSRNTHWPTTLATSYTTSDSVDISDFNAADSINIAFRFKGKQYAAAAQRKWEIQNVALTNNLTDGTKYQLFSAPYAGTANNSAFAYTGWVTANLISDTSLHGFNGWNLGSYGFSSANQLLNSNYISITGAYPIIFNPGTGVNNNPHDAWAITRKVSLRTIRPDAGITIKNVVDAAYAGVTYVFKPGLYLTYVYKYTVPGTYTATFVGQNSNEDKTSAVQQQIQITVTP